MREKTTSESEWPIPLAQFEQSLPDDPALFRFHYGLRHGTMKFGLYAPRESDTQEPHKQDEIYIIISGMGEFVLGEDRRFFGPQDVIFVKAGAVHRFENFTDDFRPG